MTVATMKSNTWDFTCKLCKMLQTALGIAFVALIAFGESAGRARAASELSRQGFHKEARALMLSPREYGKDV
jgi:hypothetical protein